MSHLRLGKLAVSICLLWMLSLWCVMTPPPAVAGEAPRLVNKLTIAMDGWGSDMIDPWEYPQPSFIQSYLNLRLVTRDENMQVQPLWAIQWSQNDQGFDITLHPKAVCQDGEQANADLLKTNLQGMMGLIEGFKGGLLAAKFRGAIESLEVQGDH